MKRLSKLKSQICKPKSYSKQSTVLSCIGAVGVVTTAVMAAKATPKATVILENERYERSYKTNKDSRYYQDLMPLEVVQLTWKCYIPAALVGLSTIACIFGANILNKRQQASLTSAYALLNESYKKYRKAAKSVYGEDADSKIAIEAAKEMYVSADGYGVYSPDLDDSEKILFYDEYSKRYFNSTMASVINAQYHFNRNLTLRGDAYLNEFYTFLGLEPVIDGEVLGWSMDDLDGYFWLDFQNRLVQLEDGLECYVIHVPFDPIVLDVDYL